MTNAEPIDDVSCVVVHHNSPLSLSETIRELAASGVATDRIVVVDNSTSLDDADKAQRLCAAGYRYLRVENRGYAAAANAGVEYLSIHGLDRDFTLVASHEAVSEPQALLMLCQAMRSDSSAAVAGPTLVNADTGGYWSLGGSLTPLLKLPRHERTMPPELAASSTRMVQRDWLDGAYNVYRTPILAQFKLDESYFLYFEETDLHTRLRHAGHRVAWVPKARVSQSSSGIPPRLLGRNLFLFNARNFSKARGRAAVGFTLLRVAARKVATGRGKLSDLLEIWRGWLAGEETARAQNSVNRSLFEDDVS